MNAVANHQATIQNEDRAVYINPNVNIYETKDGYVLEVEMPGVGKDGLEVTVADNLLTIVGRRAKDDLTAEPLFSEIPNLDYRRVFELDPAIDAAKVEARLEQGLLTVSLPKAECVKPRKIAVTG